MSHHNLNLLRTLQTLLDECHVTRTAERLNLTQSAISRQLSQLRDIFDDPLLVREGNNLLLTPRALSLKNKITGLLNQCDSLFEPVTFNPATWQGNVTLSSSDYVAQHILPDIISLLSDQAPNLNITYRLWSPEYLTQLGHLDIQLASTMITHIPDDLCKAKIGADRPVCVMRANHPLAKKQKLTINDFIDYHHISISGGGDKDSFVEEQLTKINRQRTIRHTVPFFGSALNTLCQTDMLLVIPEHIAINMKLLYDIHYTKLPIPTPRYQYWLIWHPKYNNEPSHQWLRNKALALTKNSMYSMASDSHEF
ncbi:LysR family transcriptional regulator [Piscirickettsia litoralis]|uniref:Transcriptional regulator n=1 Tax=Piscirickettsia litoralis TaxID=1891921 RepID=A0ABX3A0X9_9GAMM|nr:LysR family transcriptional regulator [Piscirickettsia litoralis]ODN42108.1 transcriptional regulator [Piscirickettsia litoralis]